MKAKERQTDDMLLERTNSNSKREKGRKGREKKKF